MASKILQPVRGTRDLIDGESRRHRHVVETGRAIASLYGASEWQTPIFETTPVFSRSLGETSDVVTKEMYTFEDRGGDSITLRPEGTAAICRALVSNGLTQTLPQKVFYAGPMFRYERPQKGRLRQFHQIGLEILGADTPLADAEAIACGQQILQTLGVADRAVLNINTLGDKASRDAYRSALVAYFSRHEKDLSDDSRMRLERNPLRILDSKDKGDMALVAEAPVILDHLTNEARDFYERLKDYLGAFDVPFTENPRIVRGLDYYNNTAFEFVTDVLGAQGTVLAGGRYDGLVAEMGGPSVPGIGWAAGIERLAMLITDPAPDRGTIAIVPLDETLERPALGILRSLREAGIPAEIAYRGNARRRLERANRSGASAAIIVGPDEFARGSVAVKSLADGSQREVALGDLAAELA